MADLAHDASGPASLELTGIAAQQASQPTSSDKGKLRVFISYSRDDIDFADQVDAALYDFECLIDRHGISGGEDWKRRLGNLISEADTVVFVLSVEPNASAFCAGSERASGKPFAHRMSLLSRKSAMTVTAIKWPAFMRSRRLNNSTRMRHCGDLEKPLRPA